MFELEIFFDTEVFDAITRDGKSKEIRAREAFYGQAETDGLKISRRGVARFEERR